jgi:hypothetical protein
MVRDATRRLAKYSGKINPDVIKNRFEVLKDSMIEQETDQFAALVSKETAIKNLLVGWGVPTIAVPFYLSYGRELYGLTRKHTGLILQQEAELATKKWKDPARGLNSYYLQVIASDVFGIDVSAAT